MRKNLVNITLLVVQDEIEHILAEQPEEIYQDFIRRDLYSELTAYVLSRIPNLYVVFAAGKEPVIKSHLSYESAERQLAREEAIRLGIYRVLEKSWYEEKSLSLAKCQAIALSGLSLEMV